MLISKIILLNAAFSKVRILLLLFQLGPRRRASGDPAPWERSDEGIAGKASKERSDVPLVVLGWFKFKRFPLEGVRG